MPATSGHRTGRRGAALAGVVFLILGTSGRPWRLFERGPYTADFYDVQARALGRGGLAVPTDVAGIEGFRIGDETHLYFGLAPAVVRIPLVVWDDWLDGRLGLISMVVAVVVGGLATARLAGRAWALAADPPADRAADRAADTAADSAADPAAGPAAEQPAWLADGAALVFALATPILWLASRPLVYHEAELWGASLAILGCERALAWWDDRSVGSLMIAGSIAAVAVHTRASSGLAPMLLLAGLAVVLVWRERDWRPAIGPAAVGVVAVATYAAVNAARFGSPLSIPFEDQVFTSLSADRRAMLEQTGGSFFSPRFAPTTVLQLFRPDAVRFDSLYPFLSWGPRATIVGDASFDTVDRSGSLVTTMPVLLVAAIGLRSRRLTAPWWMAIGACAMAAIPTLTIGFVAHRYLVDLVPLLVVLAVLGAPRVVGWRFGRSALSVAAAIGLTVAVALGVLGRNLYLLPDADDTADFLRTRYALHDVYGATPPPDLERRDTLGPPAPDGTTVLVGDCDAVAVSDGDGWDRVEVRRGGRFAATLGGRAERGIVATGPDWEIGIVEADGQVLLDYTSGSTSLRSEPLDVRVGDEIELDVLTEGELAGLEVRVDGAEEAALVAFLLPGSGPITPTPGWTSIDGDAPLCDDLATRLD
ncbi:MAG: hypothetical protein AAGG08_05420 [Actinomycetota bacterium]